MKDNESIHKLIEKIEIGLFNFDRSELKSEF